MALIHEDMLDQLKRIEFGLRLELEGAVQRGATLTGSGDLISGSGPEPHCAGASKTRGSTPPGLPKCGRTEPTPLRFGSTKRFASAE
jgi:hypothetical protein